MSKIIKTSEYVWRVGSCGNAWHGYITCWHVVSDDCPSVESCSDIPKGMLVSGGFSRGNNCFSGRAVYPRKKDAIDAAMCILESAIAKSGG